MERKKKSYVVYCYVLHYKDDLLSHIPPKKLSTPQEAAREAFSHVRVEVLSNYGEDEYTCMYRVRVHGSPVTV